MATDKPRLSISMDEETFEKVLAFKEERGIATQSKAIIRIMEMGLEDLEKTVKNKKAPLYSSEAMQMAKDYDSLDGHGQRVVRVVADEELTRCQAEKQEAERQARAAAIREQKNQMEAGEEIAPEVYPIPLYSLPMSAGTGEESRREYPEDFLLRKRPPRGTSYIAPVSGDSMEPTYQDGDKLFIHACVEIEPGQVGVFLMDGKQWVKELGDGVLISHNSEKYDPIPMREDIQCQGLVLGVCDESYFQ